MNIRKLYLLLALSLSLMVTGCSNTNSNEESLPTSDTTFPITIQHAFGESVLTKKPERIVSIAWGNQDVPLALGVVPVGASKANYGVHDDSGLLPWTLAGFQALKTETPVLFDDTDSLDFEAIADAQPDVILAAYSGITQEDYQLLSQIAPVIAFPKEAWQTSWREQITMNATGMGMKREGEALVKGLEETIANELAKYPQIEGKTAAFFYFNPADLGKFYIYLPGDPRAAYLTDLGLAFPESVMSLANDNNTFALELSSEHIDALNDVDIVVAYGDETVLSALQDDALLGSMPAIQRGSTVLIEDGSALAASSTPSALSIPATIDTYMKLIADAADKVK